MKRQVRLTLSLKDAPFFRHLSPPVLAHLESFVHHRQYDSRQIVFFPDDPCDFVYWVREGRVRVTRVSGDSRELSFRHLFPGDMLGEECFAGRARRDDYAEALMPSLLCLMRSEDYVRILNEESELTHAVLRRLAERVTETEQALAETVFNTVRSRVAAGLVRLQRRIQNADPSVLHITHQEMANLVGARRETTTATLHELQAAGILKIANRRIMILDQAALENAAHSG